MYVFKIFYDFIFGNNFNYTFKPKTLPKFKYIFTYFIESLLLRYHYIYIHIFLSFFILFYIFLKVFLFCTYKLSFFASMSTVFFISTFSICLIFLHFSKCFIFPQNYLLLIQRNFSFTTI